MIAPARSAALTALRAVHDGRAALPDSLAEMRERLRDPRDVALASEILIGTLRWRGALDHLVLSVSSRPLDRIDEDVLDILRLSAYQLVHLDRVPASAVVNDAVAMTRAAGREFAAGFVNAVLRRLSDPGSRPGPPRQTRRADRAASIDDLATRWSHPSWLVARWLDRVGPDATRTRLAHNQSVPPLVLRPARIGADPGDLAARLSEGGVETTPGRFAPGALSVVSGNPYQAPGVDPATFVVQDEASQLVALFAGARPGDAILDVCAAPGGKTTLMAAAMRDTGLLIAGDVRPARVRLLRHAVAASGARCVRLLRHDATAALPFRAGFDLVLIDAPCSGLGTLRRDPDLKWRRREGDLPGLADAERRMLEEAARVVRPGGCLVYATCSGEPEENEHVAEWFLRTHRGFRRAAPPAGWDAPPLDALVDEAGWLRTVPERHGLDAFFAARFQRSAAATDVGAGLPPSR